MMAAAIPDALRPRLGQFIRLLASDHPGEVVAAASALKRTLASCGADLNDLGDAVEHPAMILRDEPRPEAKRGRKSRPGDIELDPAQRRRVVEALRRGLAGGRMTEWEQTFAGSIVEQMQGRRWRLSEKQGDALGRLLVKVGEGSAWK